MGVQKSWLGSRQFSCHLHHLQEGFPLFWLCKLCLRPFRVYLFTMDSNYFTLTPLLRMYWLLPCHWALKLIGIVLLLCTSTGCQISSFLYPVPHLYPHRENFWHDQVSKDKQNQVNGYPLHQHFPVIYCIIIRCFSGNFGTILFETKWNDIN